MGFENFIFVHISYLSGRFRDFLQYNCIHRTIYSSENSEYDADASDSDDDEFSSPSDSNFDQENDSVSDNSDVEGFGFFHIWWSLVSVLAKFSKEIFSFLVFFFGLLFAKNIFCY